MHTFKDTNPYILTIDNRSPHFTKTETDTFTGIDTVTTLTKTKADVDIEVGALIKRQKQMDVYTHI